MLGFGALGELALGEVQVDLPIGRQTAIPQRAVVFVPAQPVRNVALLAPKPIQRISTAPIFVRPPFQAWTPQRNVALLSARPRAQATALPSPAPPQFVRTWLEGPPPVTEVVLPTGAEVTALPPTSLQQFIRTWLQEPPSVEQIAAQPPLLEFTDLPPYGPQQFVRTWLQEPPPTEIVVEQPSFVEFTALPPMGPVQFDRSFTAPFNPNLVEPAVVDDLMAQIVT